MNLHPNQRYMALLTLGGGKIHTWRRVTEFEALRNAKRYLQAGIPPSAALALRPVDQRGVLLEGCVVYRRFSDRWQRSVIEEVKAAA